jgi:phage FluMu protein Com
MKELKCGRCKKKVLVEDGYKGSRCPNCKTKDETDRINRSGIHKLDRDAKKQLKELGFEKEDVRLNSIFWSYSNWACFREKYGFDATFEKYLEALREEKLKIAHKEADLEASKRKTETTAKLGFLRKYVNVDYAPCNSKECREFRTFKLAEKFKLNEITKSLNPNLEHDAECESCSDWLYNLENGLLIEAEDVPEQKDPVEEAEEKAYKNASVEEIEIEEEALRKNEGMKDTATKTKTDFHPKPQFPKDKSKAEYEGASLFGESETKEDRPKEKSNQERLKEEFEDRTE